MSMRHDALRKYMYTYLVIGWVSNLQPFERSLGLDQIPDCPSPIIELVAHHQDGYQHSAGFCAQMFSTTLHGLVKTMPHSVV